MTALAVYGFFYPWAVRMIRSPWLWLCAISANMPDFDFLPGILLGDEALYHRGATHSIGAAAIYGLALWGAAYLFTRSGKTASRAAALGAGLFVTHLLLDLVVYDPGPPYGIQIFWPFSEHYRYSPWFLFPNLDRHPFDLSIFLRAVPVVAREALMLAPLVALSAIAGDRWKGRGRPSP